MSSDVKLFEKEEFGKVRVVMQDEDPWFVASDVAKALGYEKPNNAVNEHCKKMNKITLDPNLGGRVATVSTPPIQAIIIPESDVYRLVMRSNLPRAVEFQDWICEEVIPSIRKTGGYLIAKPDDTPEAILARAVLVAQDTIRRIEAERDEAIRTKAQIGIRREALTGLPISGILNFPNRTGVTVALAWPHQAVKSGLFCSCHRYTSSGCGHILARRRPGVREAPAAVRAGARRLAFFCAQNPKSY